MAVVSSLRSFDREQQKEYLVPIVIKDSGNPSMTGTSTLTVIIGDSNDNKMQPGSKEILVYNYMVSELHQPLNNQPAKQKYVKNIFHFLLCRVSRRALKLAESTCLTKMIGTFRTKLSIGKMERLIHTFHSTPSQVSDPIENIFLI